MRQETGDSPRRGTCFIFNYSFKIASAKTEVAQAEDGQLSQSASIAFTCIPSPSTGRLRAHNMTSYQLANSSVGRALRRYHRGHGFESRSNLSNFQG